MPSPNFDALSVSFSVTLEDPVGAAATSGVTYTSAYRTSALNRASKSLWNILYNGNREVYGRNSLKYERFSDFVLYAELSSDADSKITLTSLSRLVEPIELVLNDTSVKKRIPIKLRADSPLVLLTDPTNAPSVTSPYAYVQVISGTKYIIVKPDDATYESKTNKYVLSYLSYPVEYSAGGATDIEWNASFWEDIKLLGLAHALLDDGNYQGYQAIYQSVVNEYLPVLQERMEMSKK